MPATYSSRYPPPRAALPVGDLEVEVAPWLNYKLDGVAHVVEPREEHGAPGVDGLAGQEPAAEQDARLHVGAEGRERLRRQADDRAHGELRRHPPARGQRPLVAEQAVVRPERPQHFQPPRQGDDEIAVAGRFFGRTFHSRHDC